MRAPDCGRCNAECTSVSAPLLGDRVERLLASVGVTPEWYARAKEQFGLPPECNCGKRKAWLNRVDAWWRGD